MKRTTLIIVLLAVLIVSCLALTACAHTHEFCEWTVVEEVTCMSAGLEERVCKCGEKETRKIRPQGHDIVNNVCSDCGRGVSTGLEMELDGSVYCVTGIGTCTDTDLIIPPSYKGKAVESLKRAFMNCTGIKSVFIPASVKDVSYAFFGCKNLNVVVFEEGSQLKDIGACAFHSCDNLTDIVIPEGVTSIGEDAFYSCDSLLNITLPKSLRDISKDAFNSCRSLISITIPKGITSIGIRAFAHCGGIETVIFEGSLLISVDENAFAFCSEITNVYYAGVEEQWNNIVIGSGNEYLTKATITYNYSGK